MKTRIRKNVFETNSSSMHSLTIGNCDNYSVDYKKEEIFLCQGGYYWGPEELNTWLEKADYLSIEARDFLLKEKMLFNVLNKKFPNMTFKLDRKKDKWGYVNGNIDHQSIGEIWDEILNSNDPEKTLYDVIFGDSVIIIDNDNH